MKERWLLLLAGSSVVGVLALVILLRGPLVRSGPAASLVGVWERDTSACPRRGLRPSCAATLRLGHDQRLTLIAYHITEHGAWQVLRPGVMQWDHLTGFGAGSRRAYTWHYRLRGETLSLVAVGRPQTSWRRAGPG